MKRKNKAPRKLTDTFTFFRTLSIIEFIKDAQNFGSQLCFSFQAKQHLTWWTLWINLFSFCEHHRHSNLLHMCLRMALVRIVTSKWLLKN